MLNPESVMLALAANDQRINFAFNVSTAQCIFVNDAFYKLFNISMEEVTVSTLFEMVHEEDKDFISTLFSHLNTKNFHQNIDFRMVLPAHEVHWVRLTFYVNQQEPELIISGYLEDITSSRAHQNKLNEFANKKNAVLNILSHELAGPLASVQLFSQHLAHSTQSLNDINVQRLIDKIEQISRQSVNMIQEFIKDEFIQSAGVQLVKQRTELVKSLSSLMEGYQKAQDHIDIHFELRHDVPKLFATIDESKLIQAINNLLTNATKFTPAGGKISVTLTKKGPTFLITVADTGIGIPLEHHETLFEKFNNARRTGLRGEPSVGLGMSVIKTIIDWHNGKIWFDSVEGVGTSFYIEIPL